MIHNRKKLNTCVMIEKITKFFSFLKNLDKIKSIVDVVFSSLVKTEKVLDVVVDQVSDTGIADKVTPYLVKTKEVINKITSLIEKYSKFVGINVSAAGALSDDDVLKNLESASAELDEYL